MQKTCTRTSLCETAASMEPASCLYAQALFFTMLYWHSKSR